MNHLSNAPGDTPGNPQLRARITSAAKAVKEYTTETDDWIAARAEAPAWQSWSWRLHTELRSLLALIGGA